MKIIYQCLSLSGVPETFVNRNVHEQEKISVGVEYDQFGQKVRKELFPKKTKERIFYLLKQQRRI